MTTLITSQAWQVQAFDYSAPEAVDVLGTFENEGDAQWEADYLADVYTYDVVKVAEVTVTYALGTNPFQAFV